MDKEIKFRGQTISGEMVYGLIATKGKDWFISNTAGSPFAFQVRPETITQLFSEKDKNGKEIYEGDILIKMGADYNSEEYQKWLESDFIEGEPIVEVKRDICLIRFRFWLKNESFGYEGEDLEDPEDWEVIGNIFQNPELIP